MTSIREAINILKGGGIVIFPTDTVYGIGTKWDQKTAVNRLYGIKGTPKTQPFPILVENEHQVGQLAEVTPVAKSLIQKYWPGALTIVLKEKGGTKKIGFRMPDYGTVRELIREVGAPVIGTSANFHGMKSPKNFSEIDPLLLGMADYHLKGECTLKIESTVVDASGGELKILRVGAIKNVDPGN